MSWRDADEEFDDPADPDEDEDDETIPCPYCREPVYEGAERCPHCEHYLSREDAPWRRPWWLVVGVLVCLWVVLRWSFWLWP